MTSLHSRLLTALLSLGLSVAFTACESTPDKPSLRKLDEEVTIQRGTPGEDIVTLLGEPQQKYPLEEYSIDAEVWVYERTLNTQSVNEITDTREVRYWDPLERRYKYYEEPVYAVRTIATVEKTEILMVRNQVVKWKRNIVTDEDHGSSTFR